MSITLRNTSDTATSQTYGYASKTTPLTSTEVDKNFITLKQKCDELATDYTTTFNADGSLKDGAVTSVSITDNSVTATKIKDRSVDWAEQRNVLYVSDVSTIANKIEGTIDNYLDNTGLTAVPANTVIYFKAALDNTASVTLTVKDKNTTTDKSTTILSLEILKQKDGSLKSGDIKNGGVYSVFYDGTTVQLTNTLQDPTVEIKESISRVQTFGPVEFPIADLLVTGASTAKSHNLGVKPTSISVHVECTDDDGTQGTKGDMIPLASVMDTNGKPAFRISVDEDDVNVAASDASATSTDPVVKVIDPAEAGGLVALASAKWKVVVRGTYQNDSTYSPAYIDRDLTYPATYPTGAVTVGDYMYIFSMPTLNSSSSSNTLTKINLVTNRVIFVSNTNGMCQASQVRYTSDNVFRATNATPEAGSSGSGFVVGDVITLATGTATSGGHSKFVVKAVDSSSSPAGAVTEIYPLNDTAATSSAAGAYTTPPSNPVDQTTNPPELTVKNSSGGASSGTNLKLIVNFSDINVSRIYWIGRDHIIHYIEPNGTNNPEIVDKDGTVSKTSSWAFQVAEVSSDGTVLYGFWVTSGPNDLNAIRLYTLRDNSGYHVNSSWVNLLAGEVSKLEGGKNKDCECIQWNPIKRRLYVAARYSNLMHIFELSGSGTLQSYFDGNPNPTYKKTIGIPGGSGVDEGGDHKATNSIHVDWDADTGEEKSISITRYAAAGTVTRAAWKED